MGIYVKQPRVTIKKPTLCNERRYKIIENCLNDNSRSQNNHQQNEENQYECGCAHSSVTYAASCTTYCIAQNNHRLFGIL